MDPALSTLKTIVEIAANEPNPLSYSIFPNQIILLQTQPWDLTLGQLNELATDGYITIHQPGTTISLTEKGLTKMKEYAPW